MMLKMNVLLLTCLCTGVSATIHWDSAWFNLSRPYANGTEIESPPKAFYLNAVCKPPGNLTIECKDDIKRTPFSGNLDESASHYKATCDPRLGLICKPYGATNARCPDFAIHFGCDRRDTTVAQVTTRSTAVHPTKASTKPVTQYPAIHVGQTGTRSTAKSVTGSQQGTRTTAKSVTGSQHGTRTTAKSVTGSQHGTRTTAKYVTGSQHGTRTTAKSVTGSQHGTGTTAKSVTGSQQGTSKVNGSGKSDGQTGNGNIAHHPGGSGQPTGSTQSNTTLGGMSGNQGQPGNNENGGNHVIQNLRLITIIAASVLFKQLLN